MMKLLITGLILALVAFAGCSGKAPEALGGIDVATTPSGGQLYIDGIYKGTTPLQVSNLSLGNKTVKITKSGFQDSTEVVEVRPNAVTPIAISLEPIPTTTPAVNVSLEGECAQGWKCKDTVNWGFQMANCSWVQMRSCNGGCALVNNTCSIVTCSEHRDSSPEFVSLALNLNGTVVKNDTFTDSCTDRLAIAHYICADNIKAVTFNTCDSGSFCKDAVCS